MRRQMRLILKILAHVESTTKIGKIPLPKCDDYTQDEIAYHVLLWAMSLSLLKFVGQASLVDDAMLPS